LTVEPFHKWSYIMKRWILAFVTVVAISGVAVSSASAQGYCSPYGGYGGSGYRYNSYYSGGYGGYGGYSSGYGGYGGGWNNSGHYDYHPGSFQRHRNHFHYVPGHYDYHHPGHRNH
jgi:hypothetical protein